MAFSVQERLVPEVLHQFTVSNLSMVVLHILHLLYTLHTSVFLPYQLIETHKLCFPVCHVGSM